MSRPMFFWEGLGYPTLPLRAVDIVPDLYCVFERFQNEAASNSQLGAPLSTNKNTSRIMTGPEVGGKDETELLRQTKVVCITSIA